MPVPVVTTGFVAPDEIQNWFAAADLFVCTSQWQEPLARVHYEAMAAGLPIVTTARGGNPEVIFSEENGLVVENPEDPSNFAEKIAKILSDKSLMKKMGERGRELAVSRYKWERVASELLEVWNQAVHMTSTTAVEQDSTDKTNQTGAKGLEYVIEHNSETKKEDEKAAMEQDSAEKISEDEVNNTEVEEPESVARIKIIDVDEETIRNSIWFSSTYKRGRKRNNRRGRKGS